MIEKNIVDRVPTHAGRIKLFPVPNNPNVFDMERADEPTVAGTPIDKATLDSIIQSRLTGRFYTPSVSKVIRTQQTLTTNPVPSSGWILDSTQKKGTSGGYTVEVDSLYGSYTPEKALDGNMDTEYRSNGESVVTFKLSFPAAIKITRFKIALRADNYTRAIKTDFQGSNNGTTWTTLFTTTEKPDDLKEYTLTSTGEYTQYRLQFTASETGVNVYSFEVSGYEVTTYRNEFGIKDGVPVTWDTGQIILIHTPANANGFSVTENTFNGIRVNTILQGGRRYELRYNGSTFDAKEV